MKCTICDKKLIRLTEQSYHICEACAKKDDIQHYKFESIIVKTKKKGKK